MIRSMTGFARREQSGSWGTLTWELRTVNHRYLEVSCRLPEELRAAEGDFRQTIASVVRRGKVDCTLNFRAAAETAGQIEINRALAERLLARARELGDLAGDLAAPINPIDLLRWPGVVQEQGRDVTPLLAAAQAAVNAAQENFNKVITRPPEVRARLRARITERGALLGVVPDADRLEQEIVILAQKMDVDEELDRLRSHIAEVRKSLDGEEPAGRRLDFLMQELNREANTLSSKSQDADTTRAAVDMKVTIEQMREQVQNVE